MFSPDEFQTLAELNASARSKAVTLMHAIETDCPTCGYDEATHSAALLSCATCGGLGKVLSYKKEIRLVNADYNTLRWTKTDAGAALIMGITLYVAAAERDRFVKVRDIERSYLVIDGFDVKPVEMHPTYLQDEWVVSCQGINVESCLQERSR